MPKLVNFAKSPALIAGTILFALAGLSSSAQAQQKVLGRLGQSTSATNIYSSPSSRSRVYYKVKAYEYLIVRTGTGSYTRVVMENGKYGYISTSKVATLPYNVMSGKTQPARGTTSSRSAGSTSRSSVLNYAVEYIGTPYKWGGNDLERGIDCSGFVQQLFGKIGVDLPRTAAEQALVGKPITRLEDLQAGDRLYFWDKKRGKIGHTGIYMGNYFFIHSSTNNKGVATDDLRNPHWRAMLVAARR